MEEYKVLLDLAGATYVGVIDERTGALRAEFGSVAADSAVVSALAGMARAAGRNRTMHDVMVATRSQYHVLRLVPGLVRSAPVLVYVRLDRTRANLAAARRAMAAVGQRNSTTLTVPTASSRPDLRVAGSPSNRPSVGGTPPSRRGAGARTTASMPQVSLPVRRPRTASPLAPSSRPLTVVRDEADEPAVPAATSMFGVGTDTVRESMPPSSARAGVTAWNSDVMTMKKLLSRLRLTA